MRYKLKPNKLLPILLAVIMVLTMMPVTAFAVGEPPELVSAAVTSAGHVELTFDKEMAAPASGSAGFAVTGYGGQGKTVTEAQLVGGSPEKILLTLNPTITGGEAPWLSYASGTVKSTDEGVLAQINSFDITNSLPHPTFTTTTLPEGTVGVPYTHTFTATGGTPSYSFNREYGSLPVGLSLNSAGVLSGTPSSPVTSSFDIRVRDDNQAFERKNFTLKINPAVASAPTITGAVMDAKNNYITVTFSEGIYGDSAHSTGITKGDFEIVFAQNGGKVSGASIRWVDQVGVAISPAGGETQVEIKLNLIDGPPSGTETITISPKANSIYNASGEAVSTTENSKVLTLNSLAAQSFAEGYPKLGAAQAAGSKKVEVLAKAIQDGTLYYSVLADKAAAPTAQQLKDTNSISGDTVSWGAQGISSTIDSIISASGGTINHNTDYDLYMVAEAGNNNFSEVKKLDIKTPPDITGDTVINIAAIGGVTAPATGGIPATTVTDTAQYTGTVSWSPAVSSNFAAATTYMATITLTPKSGYTLTGVGENFFTVSGATTVTNPAGSGTVTATFPATAPLVSYVCEVSSVPVTKYESFAQALANVDDGQTITLLQNIDHRTDDNPGIVIDNKTVIFNLNGHTLDVNTNSNNGIMVKNGGKLELWGSSGSLNVVSIWDAVTSDGTGSSATVTNATSTKNAGAHAKNGGEIIIRNDATGGSAGVSAADANSKVTVGGNVKSTENSGKAAEATSGGHVTVTGSAITAGTGGVGLYAVGPNTKVQVKGSIQTTQIGVDAGSSAEVTVDGDVTVTNPSSWAYGVRAQTKSKVTVRGNISVNSISGIGAVVSSTSGFTPTEVTVDGTISGTTYIKLKNTAITENDKAAETTKYGYYTYTLTDSEGTHTVWVKDPSATSGSTGNAQWHIRAPLPASDVMEKIEYVNGRYIAVGNNGALTTSTDGVNWQKANLATNFDRLGGVAYGNGKYVLVGYIEGIDNIAARIYTSTDGISWMEKAAIPHHFLYDVAYGNGKFVAVGQAGKILTSEDGENWTAHAVTYPTGKKTTLLSITYSEIKNTFMAAGMGSDTGQHKGGIMTSTDGVNWTVAYSNSYNTIWDVSYGNGSFVAVGGQSSGQSTGPYFLATSGDGTVWTEPVTSPPYAVLNSVYFDGNRFIAAGRATPGSTAFTAVSSNAVTWTNTTHNSLPSFRSAASNGITDTPATQIVALGGYGNIYTSDNAGTIWTYRTLGTTNTLKDVAWNGSDLYVAVGVGGTIQTSPDGETWTIRTSGTSQDLNKVGYWNGQFIAIGKSGTILTSPDGAAWTTRATGVTQELKGLSYGGDRYIVVGGDYDSNPVVLTSTNEGVTWTNSTGSPISRSFVSAAYGDGVFLAVMQYGQAYEYKDTGTEFVCTRVADLAGSGCYPTDIIYGGGKFVAVGGYGEVYLSSNKGAAWTKLKTDLDSYSNGIAYGGGNLAAVGELGKIMASADGGATWYLQPSGLEINHYSSDNHIKLNGITVGDNCFVAVGENGLVLQSASFTVSADTDANDVEVAKRAIYPDQIKGSGSNTSMSRIIANMNLFTQYNQWVNGRNLDVAISWQSSKPEYISASGAVTRPSFSAGDQTVSLTATIGKGSTSDTKTFVVNVLAYENSDTQDVQTAWNALTFDTIKAGNIAADDIRSNLNLSYAPVNGVTISWASNDPAITTGGAVTRPAQGSGDRYVTLTATLTKGSVTQTKTFNLTVKAMVDPAAQDALDVADAIAALDFNTIKGSNVESESITVNMNLITSGIKGTAISWSSDKPGYITTSGTVTRPASGAADEDVKLIATVTKGLSSQAKQFTVRVKAMPATPPPSGSTGSSGGSSAPVQSYKADVSGKDAAGTLPVSVNAGSNNAAVTAGSQQGDSITGGNPVVISMPSIPGVASFTLEIPADYLSASDGKGTLTLTTNTGSVTMPSNMLADTNGTKAQITIGKGTPSGLPSDVKSAIGDRPLVQLTLTMDGKKTEWNNPDAPVTVSIPYKPTAAELANPEGIVIWYLDSSGNPVCVPGGRYDPASGSVTFMTTHFSYYAVSYKSASFHDVDAGAWYSKPIGFIAARDIASGTGNGKFSPNAKLTRGQFIAMLMNAYEITPDANPGSNFSDAGNTYYTGYLAAAKRLGISAGIGNNLFAPKKEITRQEMFTLLYNGLKVIDKLPQGTSSKNISDFSDAAQVDSWAEDAMALLVQTGTVGGSAGKLNPEATTTRAEMAQILYNLLSE